MDDPKVEEIRERRAAGTRIRLVDVDYLLTKLDEAEKAGVRAVAAEVRKKQRAYDAQAEANIRTNRAEERERALIAGVGEALDAYDPYDESGWNAVAMKDILSRLLPSTPTEEGNSDE